jgi:hypothetical protein
MRTSEQFIPREGPSTFWDAGSGLDEPEFSLDRNVNGGAGLSVAAMQAVARRQLVGSVVVALFIMSAAGVAALKPVYRPATAAQTRSFALVQHAAFTILPAQRVAAATREIETP